ncbi:MAG: hypothetical protein ACKPJD_21235 [Planctomycetaceae bacterium]
MLAMCWSGLCGSDAKKQRKMRGDVRYLEHRPGSGGEYLELSGRLFFPATAVSW